MRRAAASFLFALLAVGEAAAQVPAPAPSAAPTEPRTAAIPVPEIATRAADVSSLLSALTTGRARSAQIETIRKRLPKPNEGGHICAASFAAAA